MTITRELPAAIILAAGVAIGSAGTASADGPLQPSPGELSGTYTYESDTGRVNTWVITPCGPGCADVAVTPVTDPRVLPYGGRALLNNGRWDMTVQYLHAVRCNPPDDNVTAPGTVVFSFEAATLNGTAVNTQSVPACGDPAGATYQSGFSLTKVA
ncbi:hypothetical protein [Mycolicibacterium tusciae]|jgi:hypothetical protein|uniref:Secreted protein n=1 Tax=Mycolicibacterium tusciae TaxID=75922 RepID=A0A1X0JI80_9MYCO|nr:hypothetical protein [Mycolicibacterium tusciae]ORB62589.1 hypothetical protein BST47_23460 [Mycolicibacterium tusciae]